MNMTDYDCASHIVGVGLNRGVTNAELIAAKIAVKYDTHLSWEGYTKPTEDDRLLIRVASERVNSGA